MGGRAWARRWGAPAVALALGVLELGLVRLAGPPGRQLEVLRQLGQVQADPLASVLALLALAAEGLAAYLLAVLGLRLLASLPGAVGRLASGATLLVTPASVRRVLDLLLGGALLAQATLAPPPIRAAAMAAPAAAGPVPDHRDASGHPDGCHSPAGGRPAGLSAIWSGSAGGAGAVAAVAGGMATGGSGRTAGQPGGSRERRLAGGSGGARRREIGGGRQRADAAAGGEWR